MEAGRETYGVLWRLHVVFCILNDEHRQCVFVEIRRIADDNRYGMAAGE